MALKLDMMFKTFVMLSLAGMIGGVALAQAPSDTEPEPLLGLPPVYFPDDNLYSKEKAELGRLLYFDKRLSSDNSIACASCHSAKSGFTDGAAVSSGINGQKGGRSAPTTINRGYSVYQFWDGRAASLEDQAKGPIANPIEMTNEKDAAVAQDMIVARLKSIPGYVTRFEKVFSNADFTIDHVAKAIATFERTIVSGNSPYDRYKAGDEKSMTTSQIRGMDLFYKQIACDSCHLGFNFTNGSYVNIGIGMDKSEPDLGRYLVSKRNEDKGAFKTPTLREIEHTGPYMHDGRFKTLEEVVEHYDRGGIKNQWLDERIKPLKLTAQQKHDLVAFMKALGGKGWQHIRPPQEFPQ